MIRVNPFRHRNDSWEVGATVKVGFLRYQVIRKEPTPGDGFADAYILRLISNHVQQRFYRFVPHNGIEVVAEEYAVA